MKPSAMNFSLKLGLILMKCSILLAAITKHEEIPESRIVGGHEADPHSHPYIVSLQLRILWARAHICGGTLLNENWIISAAHCIKSSWLVRWLPMDAIAGAHDIDKFDTKVQIQSIDKRIAHPKYDGGIGAHDIAMLKTKIPFTFTQEIQPINVPVTYDIDDKALTLPGWGALRTTFFLPDLPSRLQEVKVKYIPYKECYKAVEKLKEDHESNPLDRDANICTGPLSGGIAACNGDSGGPLIEFVPKQKREIDNDPVEEIDEDDASYLTSNDFLENNIENEKKSGENEELEPVILGIVSWGISPCGEKGAPTVYTRVSQYIDFINEHINT